MPNCAIVLASDTLMEAGYGSRFEFPKNIKRKEKKVSIE
jgi:hypothetical protein